VRYPAALLHNRLSKEGKKVSRREPPLRATRKRRESLSQKIAGIQSAKFGEPMKPTRQSMSAIRQFMQRYALLFELLQLFK
jgi:hypothetical protein